MAEIMFIMAYYLMKILKGNNPVVLQRAIVWMVVNILIAGICASKPSCFYVTIDLKAI